MSNPSPSGMFSPRCLQSSTIEQIEFGFFDREMCLIQAARIDPLMHSGATTVR